MRSPHFPHFPYSDLEDLAVVLDPRDDIAVAKRDLPAGLSLRFRGGSLALSREVHAKHKFALAPLSAGQPVRMYGAVVGVAVADIAAGEALTQASLSDRFEVGAAADAVAAPSPTPTLPACGEGREGAAPEFQGIVRVPGEVGTRNHLLVAYTVPCAATVAGHIVAACRRAYGYDRGDRYARHARRRLGNSGPGRSGPEPAFPGVDDIVLLQHNSGCGMPDHGDLEAFVRWLAHYIRHPNVGGALLVSLGCEKANLGWLEGECFEPIRTATGKPIRALAHQSVGSEETLIQAGIDDAYEVLCQIGDVRRTPVPLSQLVLGTKCGGSDGFSGISANPALGWASDRVAAEGGTVLLPEVPEMSGAEHLLAARASSPTVAEQVYALVERYARMAAQYGVRLAENPSQGNIEDGLLTIQMKSLGAIRKAGTGPIAGVLEYGEWAPGPGVHLLDSPGFDVLSTAALPASGASVICFTTGLGTPYGNPIAPVIKISSNTPLAQRMPDVVDFDAGSVIEGSETVEQCGARLLETIVAVASGRRARNEENDHRESGFWMRQCNL